MKRLTVIIPTFNEEAYLERALYSINFADEIIVVDSFSTDKTLVLAENYNVKIIKRKFDDFSSQKNLKIILIFLYLIPYDRTLLWFVISKLMIVI